MNQVSFERVDNDILLIRLAGRWQLSGGLARVAFDAAGRTDQRTGVHVPAGDDAVERRDDPLVALELGELAPVGVLLI